MIVNLLVVLRYIHGFIAEMKTGEGKTLVATIPVLLNNLLKKKVHLNYCK